MDINMKRSRRVVLTMIGSGTIGAISMGFVRRRPYCGPGFVPEVAYGFDGQPVVTCQPVVVAYGGFGRFPHNFHGHAAHGGS
jgi:hypothetical protein